MSGADVVRKGVELGEGATEMTTSVPLTSWLAVIEELGPDFAARAAELDDADAFVYENYEQLKARKVFSAGVPIELGGGGASYVEVSDVLRVLAHYCGSTALALSMHMHQVMIPVWRLQNDQAPMEGLLKRIAAEELVLISSGGSDWLLGSGKAEKVEGGFRINARKVFASGVPSGSMLMTMAVYDDPENGPTVVHFPVPLGADGVKVVETWRTLGMRSTGSHDVSIEDFFVPDGAIGVKRPAGKWVRFWHLVPMLALPLIYSVYVGIAEAARDIAVRETARKKNDPAVQELVGEMETELRAAQMALRRAVEIATTAQPGDETTNEVLILRTLIARGSILTVEKAMEAVGGAGFFRALGLEKLFRDVQAARYHPIPQKAQARFSGRMALGLDIND